jgi:hypothetical protein
MKSLKKNAVLLVLLFVTYSKITAQSDLQIFGFFQTSYNQYHGGGSAVADVPVSIFGKSKLTLQNSNYNFFNGAVQQLNLLLRKELTNNFTAWVNFEINGNYNSERKWGVYKLEEAWVNYQYSDAFNVKAGLLIPRFAYLNEIKNRMPLLPYITRPLVYEASNSVVNASDYIPERAFLQASGYIPVGKITFDYAAYVGPAENAYIAGVDAGAAGGTSVDTVNFKLFGGRIGAKTGDLRLGFSGTFDKDNQQSTIKKDVSRIRLAFDFGYSIYGFFFEGEYISVKMDSKNSTQDMDKYFYYGTLGYNLTENLFFYGTYSHMKDNADVKFQNGATGYYFGAGFKPIESVVVKAAYSNYYADNNFLYKINAQLPSVNTNTHLDIDIYQLAISVLF